MTRLYGRAPKRQRPVDAVPHGHWKTSNLVGALRRAGLVAPAVTNDAINGDAFLRPRRADPAARLGAGDVVIMDNLCRHKVAGTLEAIDAAGETVLFLPPYSPDLNPIEKAFAKLKALPRAEAIRTMDALWDALWELGQVPHRRGVPQLLPGLRLFPVIWKVP